jgi:hypothetical protein
MIRRYLPAALLLLVALVGLAAWHYWPWPRPIVEQPAPAEKLPDGSSLLERRATDPRATSGMAVPKGAKVERVARVTARATPSQTAPTDWLRHMGLSDRELADLCPPVELDLSLLRMPDQSRRLQVRAVDGEILGGHDIPVETSYTAQPRKWAGGVSYSPPQQAWGAWIDRDLERVRVGLEINHSRSAPGDPGTVDARIKLGWTW